MEERILKLEKAVTALIKENKELKEQLKSLRQSVINNNDNITSQGMDAGFRGVNN